MTTNKINDMDCLNGVHILSSISREVDSSKIKQLEKMIHNAIKIGCVKVLQKNGYNTSYMLDENRTSCLDLIMHKRTYDVIEIEKKSKISINQPNSIHGSPANSVVLTAWS